jgi:Protein kinase G tetratricopeptide repeat/Protein kinase G rubredoxin domain/Protein kinase domain
MTSGAPAKRPSDGAEGRRGRDERAEAVGLDPASTVLRDPEVPQEQRFCARCGTKVGRSRGDRIGALEGFCPNCGKRFSFVPELHPGDIAGGQYEVFGALAHGESGWSYLARDRAVDRWVVLKPFVGTDDGLAMPAAPAERRFLAEIDHPNFMRVYDFMQHPGHSRTGRQNGYVVLEYVGGVSLRQLAQGQVAGGSTMPLSIGQIVAYGLEILDAVGYLHRRGLLYGDLNPDNVIVTNDGLKLTDLGAVRRSNDHDSPLRSTAGYGAPELPTRGASVASDLYSVGRMLAVLKEDVVLQTPQADVPRFTLFESYGRFLKRATHPDPERRFASAEEMAEQLAGVGREITALSTGSPQPSTSAMFSADPTVPGRLPALPEAISALPVPRSADAGSWQEDWQRGVAELAAGDYYTARLAFEVVYDAVPGELAPKLALALTAEGVSDLSTAARLHEMVWRTDPAYLGAAFGLARVYLAQGARGSALDILKVVGWRPSPPGPRPVARRRPGWRSFVAGLALSLSPVPRLAPRRQRPGWDDIEARLRDIYLRLGPPDQALLHEDPAGKDQTG